MMSFIFACIGMAGVGYGYYHMKKATQLFNEATKLANEASRMHAATLVAWQKAILEREEAIKLIRQWEERNGEKLDG